MRADSLKDLRDKRANQVALMDVDLWIDNISRAWVNVDSGAYCHTAEGSREDWVAVGCVVISDLSMMIVAEVDEALG
ncbi:MAG: hypothetical protein ALECFALPRED_010895, partial [Alectoria fallacina]